MSDHEEEEYVYIGLHTPLPGHAERQRVTREAQETYFRMTKWEYEEGGRSAEAVYGEYLGNWITWEQYCAIIPRELREEGA